MTITPFREPGARDSADSCMGIRPHVLNEEDAGGMGAYATYREHTDVTGKGILELGPGRRLDILRAALQDGARGCAAVDIVPYRKAEPGIEHHVSDGRTLPFDDGEFDIVWSWAARAADARTPADEPGLA